MHNKNSKRRSLFVFFLILVLGCSGLLIRHRNMLFATVPLEDMKVHVLVQRDYLPELKESCYRDSSFLNHLRYTRLHSYIDTIMDRYYPERDTIAAPLCSDTWLDSLNGQYFLVIRYDLPDNIRALSLVSIKNDSLISINAFRKNSMVPYTFGPLMQIRRDVFD